MSEMESKEEESLAITRMSIGERQKENVLIENENHSRFIMGYDAML